MVKRKRVAGVRGDNDDDTEDEEEDLLSLHAAPSLSSASEAPWQDALDALDMDATTTTHAVPCQPHTIDYEAAEYPDWGLAEEQAYELCGGSAAPMQYIKTLASAEPLDSDMCVRRVPIMQAIHRSWASFLTYRREYGLRTRTRVYVASTVSVVQRNQELLREAQASTELIPLQFQMWQRVFACSDADRDGRACPFSFTVNVTQLRCGQWVVLVKQGRFYHTHDPDRSFNLNTPRTTETTTQRTTKLQYVASQIVEELAHLEPHTAELELQSLASYIAGLRSKRRIPTISRTAATNASTVLTPVHAESMLRSSTNTIAPSPATKPLKRRRTTEPTTSSTEEPAASSRATRRDHVESSRSARRDKVHRNATKSVETPTKQKSTTKSQEDQSEEPITTRSRTKSPIINSRSRVENPSDTTDTIVRRRSQREKANTSTSHAPKDDESLSSRELEATNRDKKKKAKLQATAIAQQPSKASKDSSDHDTTTPSKKVSLTSTASSPRTPVEVTSRRRQIAVQSLRVQLSKHFDLEETERSTTDRSLTPNRNTRVQTSIETSQPESSPPTEREKSRSGKRLSVNTVLKTPVVEGKRRSPRNVKVAGEAPTTTVSTSEGTVRRSPRIAKASRVGTNATTVTDNAFK